MLKHALTCFSRKVLAIAHPSKLRFENKNGEKKC